MTARWTLGRSGRLMLRDGTIVAVFDHAIDARMVCGILAYRDPEDGCVLCAGCREKMKEGRP